MAVKYVEPVLKRQSRGRAIALLRTAPTLHRLTYNVSTGPIMTNNDLVEELRRQLPGTQIPGCVDWLRAGNEY